MAHIMVVDDEQDVASLIQFLLEKEGHRVGSAGNGAEALELLGVEPPNPAAEVPDLLLIDVMMPVMDGYSTCARLAQEQRTKSLPVIVLTAKGEMRELFAKAANVAAYIQKPFEPKQLRDLVVETLAKRPGARP